MSICFFGFVYLVTIQCIQDKGISGFRKGHKFLSQSCYLTNGLDKCFHVTSVCIDCTGRHVTSSLKSRHYDATFQLFLRQWHYTLYTWAGQKVMRLALYLRSETPCTYYSFVNIIQPIFSGRTLFYES